MGDLIGSFLEIKVYDIDWGFGVINFNYILEKGEHVRQARAIMSKAVL